MVEYLAAAHVTIPIVIMAAAAMLAIGVTINAFKR